jgi:hypothetical protein
MSPLHRPNQGYDLVGDNHGHADPLHRLLDKLGYRSASRLPHPSQHNQFGWSSLRHVDDSILPIPSANRSGLCARNPKHQDTGFGRPISCSSAPFSFDKSNSKGAQIALQFAIPAFVGLQARLFAKRIPGGNERSASGLTIYLRQVSDAQSGSQQPYRRRGPHSPSPYTPKRDLTA